MRTDTHRLGMPRRHLCRIVSVVLASAVWLLAGISAAPAEAQSKRAAGKASSRTSRKARAPKRAAKTSGTSAKSKKVFHTRATWYGPGFHGRRTASGERFNVHAHTLASRSLPFGTRVRVTNLKNGKSVEGRVNDRGPFKRGYGVDLSQAMARKINLKSSAPVRVEILPKK